MSIQNWHKRRPDGSIYLSTFKAHLNESVELFALRVYATLMPKMDDNALIANASWIQSKSKAIIDERAKKRAERVAGKEGK